MAIGLSQYNVALMHTVNHAFFVWQHRHFHFKYGPDLKNIFNDHIRTSLWSKFNLYLRWERLTRVNSYQNCNNVIENFYSIYLSDEIFIQEKINKGPNFISFYIKVHHIKNKCRIERILPSYTNIIVKIVKMLKVGKPVCIALLQELILSLINILQDLIIIIFNYIKINRNTMEFYFTYFFILQYDNLHYKDIIYYIYSSNNKDSINTHNQNIDLFKKECKNIFKPYLTIDKILYRLQLLILKWASLFKPTYKNIDFIRHYIHNRSWIWAKKKHPRVSKDYLYNNYFKKGSYNFSIFNINKSTVQNINLNINNKYNLNKDNFDPNFKNNKDFFYLTKPDLKFINVKINYELINTSITNLNSGIYLFWLLDDPSKCYIGSAINLKKRFKAHYNNALKTNNHKFYNSIKKYGWSNFGFKIIEFVDNKNNLLNREQFWLDKIFNDKKLKENTLNILQNSNSWLKNKHSNEKINK